MSIEEIKELLYKHYDIDEEYGEDEVGCFINGKWFSIKNVLQVIKENL